MEKVRIKKLYLVGSSIRVDIAFKVSDDNSRINLPHIGKQLFYGTSRVQCISDMITKEKRNSLQRVGVVLKFQIKFDFVVSDFVILELIFKLLFEFVIELVSVFGFSINNLKF